MTTAALPNSHSVNGCSKPKSHIAAVFEEGTPLDRAVVASFAETIRRHRQTGTPLATWRDGRVVMLDPFDVPIPDPAEVPPRRQQG
jgi:hypothetical protein